MDIFFLSGVRSKGNQTGYARPRSIMDILVTSLYPGMALFPNMIRSLTTCSQGHHPILRADSSTCSSHDHSLLVLKSHPELCLQVVAVMVLTSYVLLILIHQSYIH
jgi:hypothetical protein